MSKILKKTVLVIIALALLPIISISAYTPKELSRYAKEISERKEWQLDGKVELFKQEISTVYNGVTGPNEDWNCHTVQWLSVDSKNTAIQTVVWSDGEVENWDASDVKKTAEDYEEKHPGYIVVGAMNGDFFQINSTQEPLSYHVQEGDVLRANWDRYPDSNWGAIGFNTSKTHSVGDPARSSSMYLKLIKPEGTTELGAVSGTNVATSGDGIFIYTKHLGSTVDLSGYTVYKAKNTIYRDYYGGYFVKGLVEEQVNVSSLDKVEVGTFYVASKNVSLNVGDEIKVEYNVEGALAGAQNVVGFCYQVLKDSQPQLQNVAASVEGGYMTTLNPRALVGFKKDGSVVLMAIDGRGPLAQNLQGATPFQCGELLRLAGCVEGYNLDGGGSVTLMARIDGELQLINDPSDARQNGQPWGTLRGIGNAVLLVMRDPKIEVEEAVGNTIKVKRTGEVVNGVVENIKVKVGKKTYEMTGSELVIGELKKNEEYTVSYEYDIKNPDGTVEHGISEDFTRTTGDYAFPVLEKFDKYSVDEGEVRIKYEVVSAPEDITKLYIKYGNNEMVLEDLKDTITIEGLDGKVENKFTLMADLPNGQTVTIGELVYEALEIPVKQDDIVIPPKGDEEEPVEDEKGGCKKDMTFIVTSLISLASVLVMFKKRK